MPDADAPAPDGSGSLSLVERARAGDDRALAMLLDRYAARLLVFLRRAAAPVLGGDCDAEDLLQATFGKAWASLANFSRGDGSGSFYRWLTALGRHVIGDRLRYLDAKGRGQVRGLEVQATTGWNRAADVPDSITSVASSAAHRERAQRIEAALQTLPLGRRAVVTSCLLEAKSLAEAAGDLGISKTMVWKELQSGLSALRIRLADLGGD